MGGSQSVTARDVAPPQVRALCGRRPALSRHGRRTVRRIHRAPGPTPLNTVHVQVDGVLDKQSDHVKAWRQVRCAAGSSPLYRAATPRWCFSRSDILCRLNAAQRFFRLDAVGHKLDYWDFESEASSPPKSSVPLIGGFVEEVSDAAGSRSSLDYPYQFRVRGSREEDSYTVNAESDRERKEWIAKVYLASLPTKSGMVFKCSDHLGQWRQRFVKVAFGRLCYWETEEDSRTLPLPKGFLQLQGGRVVQLPAVDQTRRYIFAVHEPDAEGGGEGLHYMLCATSQAEYESWKQVLESSVLPWQKRTMTQRFGESAEKMRAAQRDGAQAEEDQADRWGATLRTNQMKRDKATTTAADMKAKYGR